MKSPLLIDMLQNTVRLLMDARASTSQTLYFSEKGYKELSESLADILAYPGAIRGEVLNEEGRQEENIKFGGFNFEIKIKSYGNSNTR